MPTDNPNEIIALAISPEREGWAWENCATAGPGWTGIGPAPACPICHGIGRVPVAMETPPLMPYLVEWAAKQEWWFARAAARVGRLLSFLARGNSGADDVSNYIRDTIAEAIQEQAACGAVLKETENANS